MTFCDIVVLDVKLIQLDERLRILQNPHSKKLYVGFIFILSTGST